MASRPVEHPEFNDEESDASWMPGTETESSSYETVTEETETEAILDNDEDEDGETTFLDAEEILEILAEEGEELEDDDDDDDDEDDDEDNDDDGDTEETPAAPPAAITATITVPTEPTQADNTTAAQPMTISRSELLQLLAQTGAFRRLFRPQRGGLLPGYDDDEDDDEYGYGTRRRRRNRNRGSTTNLYPKIPSEAGKELMESGLFGTNERDHGYLRKKKLTARIMRRELGLDSPGRTRSHNKLASQGLIPSSSADFIIYYDARCYSGQFSDDGNFFFSCSQDFKVRMYDTSNPYKWRYYKTVDYLGGQWTITDATLSPDNKFLAYSSIRSVVCLAPTDPDQQSEPYHLDFSSRRGLGTRGNGYWHGPFGIWSLRFSGDGREIVAGTSDHSVYVYDLETRQSILRINGHGDDVNAVCYGDKSSPHLLYSGSDDTTLKVWDRRSLGDSREAGVFLGHTEGLTYVDSKGDGRYVLSNGKDQTMKLWDLRKMMSTEKAEQVDLNAHTTGFDYRFQAYDEDDYRPHPHDRSLVTFRGHSVLKTLIRCHFSPPGSTDSRYVYSGSEDGSVYIYNLDATLVSKLDVKTATRNPRPGDNRDPRERAGQFRNGGNWETCVRDASWHPYAPVIAATSWNGYGMSNGTCTVHSWNDGLEDDEAEPRMGQPMNPQLQRDDGLFADFMGHSSPTTRRRWRT